MDLKLKAINHNEGLSQETDAFTANLYIGNVKVAECRNDGQGGCTFIRAVSGQGDKLAMAETYAEMLPPINDTGSYPLDMDLELWVSLEVEKFVKAKNKKKWEAKIKRACKKAICYAKPENKTQFGIQEFKFGRRKATIEEILKEPKGVNFLHKSMDKLKAKGYVILNTNIPNL